MNATAARAAVQSVVDFIATNPDSATDAELAALAAYQANPEAAVERGVEALADDAETAEQTPERTGRVETFVVFTREQLRHAGAHNIAKRASNPNVTTIDWADWARRNAS